ncbi:SusC/RagA family TonB-linked outer membrane protein [Pontibacter actiniarum]|uniref:SusC/RagA family TonB-linked outer membrane protein n=1 Tax=Pontibacter actiniarum TaxID=323450 RepID=A0A1X9YWL2_9BACT|nr:SusC/RagA family TonB-linked outer membrane protein [Pontibacter actiniarum]ARS37340.1 SusC/RagA family TonB-linked outer membrane protein [Pontibacter actiniarum]
MRKVLFFGLVMLLTLVSQAWVQNRTVSGKVTDRSNGDALPGVAVLVKGTTVGTTTSVDGTYSISLPEGSNTLVFRFIGYAVMERNVDNASVVNVALGVDTKQLQEVVVTAVGIERETKSLGYAATKVEGEELTKARETNVVNGLAGKVSGVRITQSSGSLGGSSKVVIRGTNGFEGSNPLFVIDGLPISNSTPSNSNSPSGNASVDYGNRAGDINPDDIESMTVLKGAAATALYGSRAKDGAIIITTKRGAEGKVKVTLNSSTRFDNVLRLPDLQNEYAQGNYGQYNIRNTNGWGPKISEVQDVTEKNFLGEDVTLQAYPDNVKDFFQTGMTYMNNLAFEGGSKEGDFRLSVGSTNQTGIIENQSLDRYNVSLNAGRSFKDKLTVRTNINYVQTEAEGRPVQSSNSPNILTSAIYGLPRTVDVNQLRDNWIDPVTGEQIALTPDKTGNNPYWIINRNNNESDVKRAYGNVILSYKPLSWLTLSNNAGLDVYTENRFNKTSKGTFGALQGEFYKATIQNQIFNNDFIVTAERDITPDFNIKAMAGHNIYATEVSSQSVTATNLTIDGLYDYANATSTVPGQGFSQRRIIGVWGDLGLSYKEYLFLNVTGRNDWSSTLPVDNRSFFYPSVSAGFVFTDALNIQSSVLDYGKIRASWANVGSGANPYSLDYVYNPATSYFVQYSLSGTFPHGGLLGFTAPRTYPNFNLKPQNQENIEFGADFRFLDNRIGLGVTYYDTKTSNQIVSLDVPLSTGYFARTVNVGAVLNKGFEVDLRLNPIRTSSGFDWTTDVNFARNVQSVEDLPEGLESYGLASGWSGLQIKAEDGKSFGLYGTAWQRDPEGNFIINAETGLREVEQGKRLGSINPDWTMGVNNTFSYKGVNLGFLVDIRKGGVFYSGTVASLRSSGLAEETLENRGSIFIDRGVNKTKDGDFVPNTTPVQSMQDFWGRYSATANTEGNVFDASYVKLREVRVSYILPKAWLDKTFIGSAELGIEGRNLWIIHSNVPHIDPESNFFGAGSVGEGVEFNTMPTTRTLGFNLRLTL